MRRRNLAKKSGKIYKEPARFIEVEQAIWKQEAPNGLCEDPYCRECPKIARRVARLIEAAKHGYYAAAYQKEFPSDMRDNLYEDAYQEASNEIEERYRQELEVARAQAAQQAHANALAHTRGQVQSAYQRGFSAGRLMAQPPPPAAPDPTAFRQQIIDEMLNECNVIAESNPNMKPGVNAVRHRIKKLNKKP